MQDYKNSRVAAMIYVSPVNTHTDIRRQLLTGCTISSAVTYVKQVLDISKVVQSTRS